MKKGGDNMSSGSFSFCGTDVKSIGLNYAPELSDTFVYEPANAQSHVETFDGHNGGYYYGSWYEPKEFILRCYFEETNIDKGIMARVYALFKVGRSGKLVFTRRPWCYYYATVTDPIQTDFSNYLNGTVTIVLKAMYPFARSDVMVNGRTEPNHEMLMANTAVFESADMVLPTAYDLTTPRTELNPILLMNPGAEFAALGISISGDVGDGVVIENKTTGQKCKMVAITKANTTNVNKQVLLDPISGKVVLTPGTLAFKYHEYGFLELEPAFPAVRDLNVTRNGTKTIEVANALNESLVGQYIFVGDAWHKIASQTDAHTLVLATIPAGTGTDRTMAVWMNEITVKPITTMDVHIEFIFKPTYA